MKREIKFRGKRLKSGGWLIGSHFYDGSLHYILSNSITGAEDYEASVVSENTVGQFTGLKDKSGNEIYEGDIVECVSWNEYFSNPETGQVMEPFRRKMYVAFQNGGFKMVEPMPYGVEPHIWDIIYNGDLTIIGNMIDNPELLKGGES